jgi:ABC-type uncharacterized transport system involved in gliding motility auxiliary subunit
VVLPWASTIDLEVSAKRVALAKTSPNSKRVSENFNLAPEGILEGGGTEPSGDKGSQIVAVYVTDKLDSHFKDAVLKKDGTDKAGDFKKETDKARLIVVSDADIARDNILQRFDSDVVFLQNLVDGLTLDESLSTIRAKTVSERQIRELDATGRSLVKYGNITAVPFILVIFAVLRFMWRRKGQRVMEEGL